MVDRAGRPKAPRRSPRTPETVEEIAARLGRPVSTVKNTWRRHPAWPDALPEMRGRRKLYAPDDVDQFVRDHISRDTPALVATRLYSAAELEAAGIGITAATIRADLSRDRWPDPDPDGSADGINRWTGAAATAALRGRRGYRRSTG